MKICNCCKQEKSVDLFNKNKAMKDGLDHYCLECRREKSRLYKLNNKLKVKKYNDENYYSDREKHIVRAKKWAMLNPEKYRISNNKATKKWSLKNLSKRASTASRRRASKLQATPTWLTKDHLDEMEDLYTACRAFQLFTGLTYHVDHIVPLQGKTVCGLHVPWNLQILEAKENIKKSNKLEEE